MSPEFQFGNRTVVVDIYRAGGETSIFPRVKMGKSVVDDLKIALGGKVWVNFDPSAEYTPVRFETGAVEEQEMLRNIEAFLRANSSRWFLPR